MKFRIFLIFSNYFLIKKIIAASWGNVNRTHISPHSMIAYTVTVCKHFIELRQKNCLLFTQCIIKSAIHSTANEIDCDAQSSFSVNTSFSMISHVHTEVIKLVNCKFPLLEKCIKVDNEETPHFFKVQSKLNIIFTCYWIGICTHRKTWSLGWKMCLRKYQKVPQTRACLKQEISRSVYLNLDKVLSFIIEKLLSRAGFMYTIMEFVSR